MTRGKTDSMVVLQTQRRGCFFFAAQLLFRISAIVCTLGAIGRMVTSDQTVIAFGIALEVRYSYSTALKSLLVVNAIVSAFSLLSLIVVVIMNRYPKSNYFYLFLHDMVIMALLISGCAAASAVGYVSHFGANEMGWMPVCDRVGKYCDKVTLAVALSYVAWFCFFTLTILSAYRARHY
ncbi:CASP-like protein 1F2 [Cornus florida]|uniref:CASP-like protein 1F2 n=1 Tax=Cornus florida TaxID=4283 RepID=UPI00289DB2FA|nr:CASP-like protein 1F2 [Cornus florida]